MKYLLDVRLCGEGCFNETEFIRDTEKFLNILKEKYVFNYDLIKMF